MAYTDSQQYIKFKSAQKSGDSGCGCKSESENCGCCPPGLINYVDADGDPQGCITPNDAELLFKATIKCPDGYVKVLDLSGNFVGCLTPTEYATYKAA